MTMHFQKFPIPFSNQNLPSSAIPHMYRVLNVEIVDYRISTQSTISILLTL